MKRASPWWVLALVLCYPAIQAGLTLQAWRAVPDRLVAVTDARLASVEKTADARLASIEQTVDGRLASLQSVADKRLISLQADASSRLDDAIRLSDAQLTATRAELLAEVHPITVQATGALTAYTALPRSIQPTIDAINDSSPILLRRIGDTVSETRITMLETAQTMKTVRDSAPALIEAAQKSADGSAASAEHIGILTDNLAKSFKPLPRWVSIPLAISGGVGTAIYPWASLAIQRQPATVKVLGPTK